MRFIKQSRKVKTITKEQLLELSAAKRIKMKLYDQEAEMKKYISLGDMQSARIIATNITRNAAQFGLYDICANAYQYLMQYHLSYEQSTYLYKDYKIKYEKAVDLRDQETFVQEQYLKIHSHFDRKSNISKKVKESSQRAIERVLLSHDIDNQGPYYMHKYYLLLDTHYSIMGDYEQQIKTCLEAFRYFNSQFVAFDLSKHLFLNHAAEAYMIIKEYDNAQEMLDKASTIDIERYTAYSNHILLQCRLKLSRGLTCDHHLNQYLSGFKGLDRLKDLIKVYNQLIQGISPESFTHLNDYMGEPAGFGIALNVARIWAAYLQDNEIDHKDRIKTYIHRHLKDDSRSAAMLRHLSGHSAELPPIEYNRAFEIVPFELIMQRTPINR